ncbi:MAG: nucleotidyltransferase domain-containing protein [Ignavibacteriae bacterium]|nr:nucleotidyltransferase domain-containing protein [Ignavibacteriota bacterium]NOG96447.1 nucleotidyltransferase domain-containing protein [Ignavibacteriota bacterium]
MAKIPNTIKELIESYINSLNAHGINIIGAFIFGSYAKGNYTELSDIDIALVSDEFDGVRFYDKNKIRKITLTHSSKIEAIPFNPKDFTIENPFAKEIIDTGIKVA